jgi:D-alanine-D-alanine ligase
MDITSSLKRYENKKIGVLMGGLSSEREISLRSGDNIFRALKKLGLNTVKIDVGRGICDDLKKEKIDIAFIALHGKYGEDGAIQGLLEIAGIPYTGTGVLGSAIGMNKAVTKKILSESGIPVPKSISIQSGDNEKLIRSIQSGLGYPVVLKPNCEGSSIGVVLIKDEEELRKALPSYQKDYPDSFIEEFIKGREITIGVVGDSEKVDILPILELKPKNEFYDFEAKYTKGMTDFEIPAKLSGESEKIVHEYCRTAFRALHCNGVIRLDAILDSNEKPYFLEINTLPGMTDTSDIPAMAAVSGSFEEIAVRILDGAV